MLGTKYIMDQLEYKIQICDKPDNLASNVKKLDPSVNLFQCSQCPYQTPLRYRLKCHVITHKKPSEVNYYECDQCPAKFRLKTYLTSHIKKVHFPRMLQCNKCLFQTTQKINFKSHFVDRQCLNKKMFKCRKCNFKADLRIKVTKHEKIHEKKGEKRYQCPQCKLEFLGWGLLKIHQFQNHKKALQYVCEFCFFKAPSPSSLESHKKTHSELLSTGLISCSHCKAVFFSVRDLKFHIQLKHLIQNKNYKCLHCGFRTLYPKNLRRHVRIHVRKGELTEREARNVKVNLNFKAKDFKCSYCGFLSSKSIYLVRHIQKHLAKGEISEGEATLLGVNLNMPKTYTCDRCSYKTGKIRYFKTHMELHEIDCEVDQSATSHGGSFKCLVCNFSTKYSNNLTRHIQSHVKKWEIPEDAVDNVGVNLNLPDSNKPKTHKCFHCGFLSVHSGSLCRHIRNHIRKGEISHSDAKKVKGKLNVDASYINTQFKCLRCKFQTTHYSSIGRHMHKHIKKGEITKNEAKTQYVRVKDEFSYSNDFVKCELVADDNESIEVDSNQEFSMGSKRHINRLDLGSDKEILTDNFNKEAVAQIAIMFDKPAEALEKSLSNELPGDNPTNNRDVRGKTMYKCQLCDTNIFQSKFLQTHTNIHSRESGNLSIQVMFHKYQNTEFVSIVTIDATQKNTILTKHHKEKDINDTEVIYSCDECNFKSNIEESLQKHKSIHWTPGKQAAYSAKL